MKRYTYADIVDAYRQLGVEPGMTISLKTDLTRLGLYEQRQKSRVLEDHYRALRECLGAEQGTLVVSTATTNLCDTDVPYDPLRSPSVAGVLTEHIRRKPDAVRSFHAFESYAAVGKLKHAICGDVSQFSYGIDSPEDRLVKSDAWCLVIGATFERCCSTIHHIESVVGVPYRYMKEIHHPVVSDQGVRYMRFFRNVWYRGSGVRKDTTAFFAELREHGFSVRSATLGNGTVVMYRLRELYDLGVRIMTRKPYCVLLGEPETKPWME